MQVKCIRAFGHHKPGDLAEVPDGAEVDPYHYEPAAAPAPPDPPKSPSVPPAALLTPKEM
jgi:hypothetical protein